MNTHLHLNLIKDEELVSSSPIRSQIIAPVFVTVITLSTLIWWLFLFLGHMNLKRVNKTNIEINQVINPAYQRALQLTEKEKELAALSAQIEAFNHSRLEYGAVLSSIPKHVDSNIQFTILELPAPPPPLFEDKKPGSGPTNIIENAEFKITGKTTGAKAFDAVDQLLKALNSDAYTNLIQSAFIPKGSFRQDSRSKKGTKESLLFAIKCRCRPRRFQ